MAAAPGRYVAPAHRSRTERDWSVRFSRTASKERKVTVPGDAALGLRVLAIVLGVFLIFMGIDKIEWLADSAPLAARLDEWRAAARPRCGGGPC